MATAGRLSGTDSTATELRAAAVQELTPVDRPGLDRCRPRRDSVLVDVEGNELTGEIDVQGNAWDPAAWWQATANLSAWSGGSWLGSTWTGDDWEPAASDLSSSRWSSSRWSSIPVEHR